MAPLGKIPQYCQLSIKGLNVSLYAEIDGEGEGEGWKNEATTCHNQQSWIYVTVHMILARME